MSQPCSVRVARTDDAGTIHDIHVNSIRELCQGHYSAVQIDAWVRSKRYDGYLPALQRGEMFLAEANGKTVGFGHAVAGEILAIFVAPHAAGQGVGTLLLEAALTRTGAGTVRVESTVNGAPFYAKHGFAEVGQKFVQREGVPIPVILMERRQRG